MPQPRWVNQWIFWRCCRSWDEHCCAQHFDYCAAAGWWLPYYCCLSAVIDLLLMLLRSENRNFLKSQQNFLLTNYTQTTHRLKLLHLHLNIDPLPTTTGHNLIVHAITFRLSPWESSYALYSHYSSCISAHIRMRHSYLLLELLGKIGHFGPMIALYLLVINRSTK